MHLYFRAVVLAFNLPGIDDLILSRAQVLGIYNGSITMWNNTSIQKLNPNVTLPGQKIIVLARADKSGTTEIFTSGLSRFSSNWNNSYGTFSVGLNGTVPVKWNASVIDYYGHTNRGMSGLVLSLRYSIGYLAAADASGTKTARLQNKAGNAVEATTKTVQNAMEDFVQDFSEHLTLVITDAPGLNSYPLSGFTYLILYLNMNNSCDTSVELYRYIEWFLGDEEARTFAESLNLTPVSDSIASTITKQVLYKMKCAGQWVRELVAAQKLEENRTSQTWLISVYVSVPILCILLAVFISYISWHQIKLNRAIIFGEWLVPAEEIHVVKNEDMWGSLMSSTLKTNSSCSYTSKTKRTILDNTSQIANNADLTCRWRHMHVRVSALRDIQPSQIKTKLKKNILWMKNSLYHVNILRFYGITFMMDKVRVVSEYTVKGALHDIIQNDKYNLDDNFKFSLCCDVASGMNYLHSMGIIHGQLNSENCYLDNKWNVKV